MEEFILHSSKLSLPTFLSSFSYLKKIQLINGWFTFDDLCEALNSSPDLSKLSPLEINFYSMLFLESCCLGIKSTVSFTMPPEILANEKLFLKNLLSRVETKNQGNSNPLIEEFINEVTDYLNGIYIPSVKPSLPSNESCYQSPQMTSNNSKSNTQSPVAQALNTSSSDTSSTNSIADKTDPMTVFLAHLRKNNMDILFPRGIHDKILACIYVVMSMGYYSFHKDIIEDVMILKSSLILTEISDISKTKIRGVISLLKYSSIIVVDDSKTRLIFASGIDSFQELRARHDAYINRFILDNQISIPSHLKSELIWQFDDNVKQQRIDIITQMIQKLESYLQEYFLKTKSNNKEISTIIPNQMINPPNPINNSNNNINSTTNNIMNNNNSNYYSQGMMRNNSMNNNNNNNNIMNPSNMYNTNTHNNNNNYYHNNNSYHMNNNNNNYQNNHMNNKQTYSNPSQVSSLQYAARSNHTTNITNNNHMNLMDNHSRRMFSQQRYPNPRQEMNNSSYVIPPPPGIIGFAESKEKTPPTKYRPHDFYQTGSSNYSSSFHGMTSSASTTSSTDFFYNGFDGLFQTTSPQINNNNNLKSIII